MRRIEKEESLDRKEDGGWEIGARCLFVKSPLSLRGVSCERGFGNGGELLRRLGTVERNGQQYCRRGSGDLRGADRGRARERAPSDMGN